MFGLFTSYPKPIVPVYAFEKAPSDKTHSATIVSTRAPDKAITSIRYPGIETLYDVFNNGLRANPTGNCLGHRIMTNGVAGKYEWLSYKDVDERRRAFASGLLNLDLVPSIDGLRMIGIYSKNCIEWTVAEQACDAYNFCVVPIYDTLGADTVEYILKQTDMKTCICGSKEILNVLALYPKINKLQVIIQIGEINDKTREVAKQCNISLYSFEEVLQSGRNHNRPNTAPNPEDVCTLCYTSGTTGVPKGAMLTHRNFVSSLSACLFMDLCPYSTDVYISYLPLAHVLERMLQQAMLISGGAIGFSQGDTRKIVDDLKELRPTVFCSVPRLLNRVYDSVKAGIKKKGYIAETLFTWGMENKKWRIENGYPKYDWFYDYMVFNAIRASAGLDRTRVTISGSAPLSGEVLQFLRCVLNGVVIEGYGATETSGPTTLQLITDQSIGAVGGPIPSCEFRLSDVPEMGYFSTDRDHNGTPCLARGELCIRGYNISKGYFKSPEITAKAFDEDGFFMTGDIAVFLPNYAIKIVDRKKNFFKLSQGEYVAAEKLEIVYGQSPFISQLFVHGDSLQSYLVAVVVPEKGYVMKWASTVPALKDKSLEYVCGSQELHDVLVEEFKRLFTENQLRGFERIVKFDVESEGWSVENGLLTPTFKLLRKNIKAKYEDKIAEMYGN